VLITEFAIHDWGGNYTDAQIQEANREFLNIVVPALESRSYVAGYSLYNWFSDAKVYTGSGNNLVPTPMAYTYLGTVQSGQAYNFAGQDLKEHVASLTGGEFTETAATGNVKYINAVASDSAISGSVDWGMTTFGNWVRVQPGATLTKTGANKITFTSGTIT